MGALKRLAHYFISEPFYWLFCCFFQPARFQKDFTQIARIRRIRMMERLFLPMFLCTYPIALLIRIALFAIFPHFYHHYLVMIEVEHIFPLATFLFDATWATILSCVMGSLFGSLFGTEYGIVFGLTDAVVNGIVIYMGNIPVIMLFCGVASGLLLGLTFNSAGAIKRGGMRTTAVGIVYGVVAGSIVGVVMGVVCGFGAGSLLLLMGEHFAHLQPHNGGGLGGNIVGILAGVTSGCLVMKIVDAIARGNVSKRRDLIDVITRVGIAVAGALGATIGLATGNYGLQGKSFLEVILLATWPALVACATFIVSYVPGYYRLPLYPISAFFMVRAYALSRKNPAYVFHYLHRSSIYWDECVFPPLPSLKSVLLIAVEQNKDETLSELLFILQERPQQYRAAQDVALEIALNDLLWREMLRDIRGAQAQLARIVTQEIRHAHPSVAYVIQRLEDASQDATNYYAQISWQGRSQALKNMLTNLQQISGRSVFSAALLNIRFEKVVQKWQEVARNELESLAQKQSSDRIGRIENPYVPGLILEQRDPLFVGRGELARQLSMALQADQPPAFFLTGERRMGKSSILKQLPILLGSRYLSIFYDLQSTGITSSVAALLAAIAEEVQDNLLMRGMLVHKLEYDDLREDLRENEAVAYLRFSRWLKDVERVLAQDDRMLLLAFDEFEKLAEAEQKGYLDLGLLFNWLRSLVQRRSHIALLFSGVKSVSDMGAKWAGYFMNVELLRVSFLQPEEARHLIRQPVPDFPGEHIFGSEVMEEILRVTGSHPFLIQALCSALITRLNKYARQQATMDDITASIDDIFKKWGDSYFGDLWERTDAEQRICLKAVCTASGSCTADDIQRYSNLDEVTLVFTLEKLCRRDLLRQDEGAYCIAAPIFAQWLAVH